MTEERNHLHQRKIYLLDGDITGSLMKFMKLSDKHRTYRYNTDHQDIVQNIHMEFLHAGANLIRTNTCHATLTYLKNDCGFKLEDCTINIRSAAVIAQSAVAEYNKLNKQPWGPAQVVGCCGHLRYLSRRLQMTELKDVHLHRIRTLVIAGVRIISLEGVQNLDEAFMLLDIIREFPYVRVLIMFDSGNYTAQKKHKLRYDVTHCYYALPQQILAIGISCGDPYLARQQLNAINELHSIYDPIPLIACTNTNENDTTWLPVAVQTKNPIKVWESLGLRFVGGCNNVFIDDIKRIRSKLTHGQVS